MELELFILSVLFVLLIYGFFMGWFMHSIWIDRNKTTNEEVPDSERDEPEDL